LKEVGNEESSRIIIRGITPEGGICKKKKRGKNISPVLS
jgi:hypothetical protein